jgi:soluble lytic murein transglycosylase
VVTLHRYHQSVKRRRVILVSTLIVVAGAAFYFWREAKREKEFFPQIQAAARQYGVDPLLVKAVVWRESRFDPVVRGGKGELGLMQLQEIAAQEWADRERVAAFEHEHCIDPGTNTLAGTFYLAKLLKRYANTDDPAVYALADYNAGRSNVLRWNSGAAATNSQDFIGHITFPGTQKYVKTVLRRYELYRFLARFGLS